MRYYKCQLSVWNNKLSSFEDAYEACLNFLIFQNVIFKSNTVNHELFCAGQTTYALCTTGWNSLNHGLVSVILHTDIVCIVSQKHHKM